MEILTTELSQHEMAELTIWLRRQYEFFDFEDGWQVAHEEYKTRANMITRYQVASPKLGVEFTYELVYNQFVPSRYSLSRVNIIFLSQGKPGKWESYVSR